MALAANPVILGLAALAVAVLPLVALRATGLIAAPRPWPPAWRRVAGCVAGLLAVASWLYQWHRLGLTEPFEK